MFRRTPLHTTSHSRRSTHRSPLPLFLSLRAPVPWLWGGSGLSARSCSPTPQHPDPRAGRGLSFFYLDLNVVSFYSISVAKMLWNKNKLKKTANDSDFTTPKQKEGAGTTATFQLHCCCADGGRCTGEDLPHLKAAPAPERPCHTLFHAAQGPFRASLPCPGRHENTLGRVSGSAGRCKMSHPQRRPTGKGFCDLFESLTSHCPRYKENPTGVPQEAAQGRVNSHIPFRFMIHGDHQLHFRHTSPNWHLTVLKSIHAVRPSLIRLRLLLQGEKTSDNQSKVSIRV